MMNPFEPSSVDPQNELTLTRSEIAFLNATIELMLEDESDAVESVTVTVADAAAIGGAILKLATKVNKWVEKNGGWVAVATAVADWLFGFQAEAVPLSREQTEAIKRMRDTLHRGVSVDELIALRDQIEAQMPSRPSTPKAAKRTERRAT